MTLGPREGRTLLPAKSLGLDHCQDWTPQAAGARGILHGKKAPLSLGSLALALFSTAACGGGAVSVGLRAVQWILSWAPHIRPSDPQWPSGCPGGGVYQVTEVPPGPGLVLQWHYAPLVSSRHLVGREGPRGPLCSPHHPALGATGESSKSWLEVCQQIDYLIKLLDEYARLWNEFREGRLYSEITPG